MYVCVCVYMYTCTCMHVQYLPQLLACELYTHEHNHTRKHAHKHTSMHTYAHGRTRIVLYNQTYTHSQQYAYTCVTTGVLARFLLNSVPQTHARIHTRTATVLANFQHPSSARVCTHTKSWWCARNSAHVCTRT